ncbi:hypothetical protein L210DRAFT_3657808 [Boletus edulis BED1]|uniref:Uncharacterized protein n=1 Tax=Boletus edulis BED1 TaxID=1328754 RepID=A0AAD4BB26_BOLED|nr:hypothetical protein L210DRAFT_3657808 [Boletus edulis BED1]
MVIVVNPLKIEYRETGPLLHTTSPSAHGPSHREVGPPSGLSFNFSYNSSLRPYHASIQSIPSLTLSRIIVITTKLQFASPICQVTTAKLHISAQLYCIQPRVIVVNPLKLEYRETGPLLHTTSPLSSWSAPSRSWSPIGTLLQLLIQQFAKLLHTSIQSIPSLTHSRIIFITAKLRFASPICQVITQSIPSLTPSRIIVVTANLRFASPICQVTTQSIPSLTPSRIIVVTANLRFARPICQVTTANLSSITPSRIIVITAKLRFSSPICQVTTQSIPSLTPSRIIVITANLRFASPICQVTTQSIPSLTPSRIIVVTANLRFSCPISQLTTANLSSITPSRIIVITAKLRLPVPFAKLPPPMSIFPLQLYHIRTMIPRHLYVETWFVPPRRGFPSGLFFNISYKDSLPNPPTMRQYTLAHSPRANIIITAKLLFAKGRTVKVQNPHRLYRIQELYCTLSNRFK